MIQDHTEAFLDLLRDGLPSDVAVGDGIADGTAPHAVVYLIAGGLADGPLCEPQSDVEFVWQVTSVGKVPREARWLADKVRTALHGESLAITGRLCWPLRLSNSSPGTERDDAGERPLFYAWDRFTTVSSPAAAGS